ncbi:MAG: hypothetical protein Q6363_004210 [Candidatus Njordarchaeota archaeon]
MKEWKVTFEGEKVGREDDFDLIFSDMVDVWGEYTSIKPVFLERLFSLVETQENYSHIPNIKRIESPEKIDVNINDYIIVLCIDKNELRFGLLIKKAGGGLKVIAIWPRVFATAVKDNKRLLAGVVAFLVERPDNWRRVDIVTPIE